MIDTAPADKAAPNPEPEPKPKPKTFMRAKSSPPRPPRPPRAPPIQAQVIGVQPIGDNIGAEAHAQPPNLISDRRERAALADGPPRPKAMAQRPEPLPRPPKFDCSETPQQFFTYWADIDPNELDRTIVYVYRNWPVWDAMLLLSPEEKDKVVTRQMRMVTNIGKLATPFDRNHWEQEIYHRFGSGDYHFKLNDIALGKTVCMTNVRGLRDFEHYPPVLDPRSVVVSDPANASYLERMRLKGVQFPGDAGYSAMVEGEEMAATATDTITKLTDTVISMADKVSKGNQQPTNQPPQDARGKAEVSAVDTVADGARRGFEIMGAAMAEVQKNNASAQDPKSYFKDIMELAVAMRGPTPSPEAANSGMNQMLAMMEKQMEMQRQMFTLQMEELKSRLIAAERTSQDARASALAAVQTQVQAVQHAQQQNQNGVSGNGPQVSHREPDILSQLDKLLSIKDRLMGLDGGNGGGGADVPGWVPFAAKGLETVANIAYNIAAAKQGGPGMMPQQPAPMTTPGGQEFEDPNNQEMGGPPAPGQGYNPMDVTQFAQRLHGPLVKALNEGIPGYEFGARMLLHEGAMVYGWLAGQSPERLYQLLQSYPPMWADVLKFGATRVEQFIGEFQDQDETQAMALEMQSGQMPAPNRPKKTGTPQPQTAREFRESPRGSAPAPAPAPRGSAPAPSGHPSYRQPTIPIPSIDTVAQSVPVPVEVLPPIPTPRQAPAPGTVRKPGKGPIVNVPPAPETRPDPRRPTPPPIPDPMPPAA